MVTEALVDVIFGVVTLPGVPQSPFLTSLLLGRSYVKDAFPREKKVIVREELLKSEAN